MLKDLVLANRSYRRFVERDRIDASVLSELADMARQTPSAANLQPLKYMLVSSPQKCAEVFSTLSWAGYLTEWPGPGEGERPSGYIVILGDTTINKNPCCDYGIAAQTMLLAAVEKGYGGCMFGSIDRDTLRRHLSIPDHLDILLVIALGKPAEKIILEDIDSEGSIKYYRDDADVHHVPKRKLDDIIIGIY